MIVLPTTHYRGIHFPRPFNLPLYLELRGKADEKIIDSLVFSRRIGSDSLHAKIYSAKIDDVPVVVKVNKTLKGHHNELVFNKHLNDPDHFLYFIKGLTCEGQGFLIMETALSDLVQRLDYSEFTNEDLHRLFDEILSSLLRLAELRVYHGDLHCGNVFFVMRNCTKAVIGDFGESSFSESTTSSSSDLFYFVNSLRQRLGRGTRSGPFILKLDLLVRFMGSTCGCTEDDFDRYLETGSVEAAVIRCNVEFLQRVKEYWSSL